MLQNRRPSSTGRLAVSDQAEIKNDRDRIQAHLHPICRSAISARLNSEGTAITFRSYGHVRLPILLLNPSFA